MAGTVIATANGRASGKDQVILRRDLDELVGSGKSLMPEGLEKDLSRQDLADVIAYVAVAGPDVNVP